jgi:hypothetical protein
MNDYAKLSRDDMIEMLKTAITVARSTTSVSQEERDGMVGGMVGFAIILAARLGFEPIDLDVERPSAASPNLN